MKQEIPSIEEIGARMDALGNWDSVGSCHWAIKPLGSALPYFFTVLVGKGAVFKVRVLLLEGWQTFHDFVAFLSDSDYGFVQNAAEFTQYDLNIMLDGSVLLLRHQTGYSPCPVSDRDRELCRRMYWQAYGMMMRLEGDEKLPLSFADRQAMFARVEKEDGVWVDEPLVIPPPRPFVEQVSFPRELIGKAKDCPVREGMVLEMDMLLMLGYITRETRPRTMYMFAAVDATTGKLAFRDLLTLDPESGLRGLWQSLPMRMLSHFIKMRAIPGEIRMRSGMLFRLMRPLEVQFSVKFVKCQQLDNFAVATDLKL